MPADTNETPLRELLNIRLQHPSAGGEPTTLDQLVSTLRGNGVSWNKVSLALHNRTGLYVTGESLRQWYGGDQR